MTRSLALQEHTTEGGLRPKKGIGTDSKKDVTWKQLLEQQIRLEGFSGEGVLRQRNVACSAGN